MKDETSEKAESMKVMAEEGRLLQKATPALGTDTLCGLLDLDDPADTIFLGDAEVDACYCLDLLVARETVARFDLKYEGKLRPSDRAIWAELTLTNEEGQALPIYYADNDLFIAPHLLPIGATDLLVASQKIGACISGQGFMFHPRWHAGRIEVYTVAYQGNEGFSQFEVWVDDNCN